MHDSRSGVAGGGRQSEHAGPVVSRKPGLVPDAPQPPPIKMKSKNALRAHVLRPPRTAQAA